MLGTLIAQLIVSTASLSVQKPEIVAATAQNERFRFSPEESKLIRSYPDKPTLHKLGEQAYARRVGNVLYVVRRSIPELQELIVTYDLLSQIVQSDMSAPVRVAMLAPNAQTYLQEIIAREMDVDIDGVSMIQNGHLEVLPRKFVTLTSKEFGDFTIIASPDLASLSESDRKEFLESRLEKVSKQFNRDSPGQKSSSASTPCAQVAQPDSLLLGGSFSRYRGYQLQLNSLNVGINDMNLTSRILSETVAEAKELIRTELREKSKELDQILYKLDKFRFPLEQRTAPTESEINRFRESLKFNLEVNGVEPKRIDNILQKSSYKSSAIGLVLFLQVRLPNGSNVQLTPAINL